MMMQGQMLESVPKFVAIQMLLSNWWMTSGKRVSTFHRFSLFLLHHKEGN